MSNTIQKVRAYLKAFGIDDKIKEFETSSATVELAAKAVGTDPARIAKTLSFQADDRYLLIVCAGDTKIDNAKYKACFHTKAKCLLQTRYSQKSDMILAAYVRLLSMTVF